MIMTAVLAVALGLTPAHPDRTVQTFAYRDAEFANLIGPYRQVTDSSGTTHLRGVARVSGKPFDLAVSKNGLVEGTVGEMDMTFTLREAA